MPLLPERDEQFPSPNDSPLDLRMTLPLLVRPLARLTLTALLVIPALAAYAQRPVLDRIVAVVGDEIITQSELDLQMLRLTVQGRGEQADEAMRRRVLEDMIGRKLILAQAVLDSVKVTDEQVDAQLDEQIRMFLQSYGSIERLEQAAGMTIAQMKREFREDIRKSIMVEMLQREKIGPITVTHREVEDFFRAYRDSLPLVPEQVHARQIIMFPRKLPASREAARVRADALLDSLRKGADFGELARRYSDDPGSARLGGDLGEARRGVFVRAFEEAAFALKPGEISPVVETEFGFHIIKLLDRQGERIHPMHILVRIQQTAESDSAVIRELTDLRRRILAGEDFETLARTYSQEPVTRPRGGDLGLVETTQLSEAMRLAQQNLAEGEVSEPFKLPVDKDYAFAIVQLLRRIPPHPPNLADDYQRIANYARIVKQNNAYNEWVESIKRNVYWKVLL
ncbi:MAG: peptidylprolyl isomerase [Bacteroidota bacterium]|nr:peptidylprolyl isomerase [Bacteroidota bacterium]